MEFTSKTGIIIQARMGSSRMPNKILLPFFGNKSILEIIIAKFAAYSNNIIVATTDNSRDDAIVNLCQKINVQYFRGNEDDVLLRFIDAADFFGFDSLIRVCSDNPFLLQDEINRLYHYSSQTTLDYVSFCVSGIPSIKTHFGFWTEFVTVEALKRVSAITNEFFYHEHVTNYIYEHPDCFNFDLLPVDPRINDRTDIRLTIDTPVDFEMSQNIYEELARNKLDITYDNIFQIIENNNMLDKMQIEIRNNSK